MSIQIIFVPAKKEKFINMNIYIKMQRLFEFIVFLFQFSFLKHINVLENILKLINKVKLYN